MHQIWELVHRSQGRVVEVDVVELNDSYQSSINESPTQSQLSPYHNYDKTC